MQPLSLGAIEEHHWDRALGLQCKQLFAACQIERAAMTGSQTRFVWKLMLLFLSAFCFRRRKRRSECRAEINYVPSFFIIIILNFEEEGKKGPQHSDEFSSLRKSIHIPVQVSTSLIVCVCVCARVHMYV
jgi:hypothetical protein